MTPDVIAAYGVAIAALVSALISQLVKPLVESLPFATPGRPGYNAAAHDALLRAANVLFNVLGVALMGAMNNQLTLANWLPVTLQIIVQSLGSHAFYQAVKPTAPALPSNTAAPSPAVVAAAMNAAIAASQRPTASFSVGMPNTPKTLGPDTPPAV